MHEPSEEDVQRAREAYERAAMFAEMMTRRIRRMIAEELTYDQLEALQGILSHVANAQDSSAVANWYEGIVHGTLTARDILLGEKEDEFIR